MRFELGHVPMPEGYGDAILSLGACKLHLRVTSDRENELISALRDAAIEFVERYCGVKLGPVAGMIWRAEGFPSDSNRSVSLAIRPVTSVTAVTWQDGIGDTVDGIVSDFRISSDGELLPTVGASWPSGIGGAVAVTFDAGYAAGEVPSMLLSAVKLMLGHLFKNREAVVATGLTGEVPFGVTALCAPFRPVLI